MVGLHVTVTRAFRTVASDSLWLTAASDFPTLKQNKKCAKPSWRAFFSEQRPPKSLGVETGADRLRHQRMSFAADVEEPLKHWTAWQPSASSLRAFAPAEPPTLPGPARPSPSIYANGPIITKSHRQQTQLSVDRFRQEQHRADQSQNRNFRRQRCAIAGQGARRGGSRPVSDGNGWRWCKSSILTA